MRILITGGSGLLGANLSRDFSEDRVESGLEKLREAREKLQQKTLF